MISSLESHRLAKKLSCVSWRCQHPCTRSLKQKQI